ncbi:MAG TPA: alpha/beta hydrolase [Pseudonocardiaceae bacterium]|nr:alpha/beta hydrolase [Pseudonocardiaceae bacterium]
MRSNLTSTSIRRWSPRSRRLAVQALAVVFALGGGVLGTSPSALAGWDSADPYVDARVDAVSTPVLGWTDCQDGFQCGTAHVPLDYDRPNDTTVELAVIKLPASDPTSRIGTLFVNFGGPGPSGVDRLRARASWPWLFSEELRSRFDLVSWDPRGVSRSTAVRCFGSEAEQQAFLGSFPEMPADPGGEPVFYDKSAELADRCQQHAGELLEHVSTANTARDLELLRRAVGDEKLTYHGISYGTYLGAVYANLFPGRVRALAFDGSMDFVGNATGHGAEGTTTPHGTRQDTPRGIAETFDSFLRQCTAAGPRCAFSSGDPRAKWVALAERARQQPILIEGDAGPQTWTYSAVINAAAELAQPQTYPDLATLLQKLYDASTRDGARSLAATAAGGEPYLANRTEAFNAIQCSDSTVPTDTAIYSQMALSEDSRVPYFGRIGVFDMMPCAFWRAKDTDRYTGPWNRRTAAPILVLNSRFDPSTPLHGAYDGARELARARVLVVEGAGHTTMYLHSTCAERVKRDYLISGTLPVTGSSCGIDRPAFG